MKLTDIIKGSEYDLSLFSEEKIAKLESCIVERAGKKGSIPSLSAEGTLNKSLENTKKIRKYRNFKELRYFSFMPIQLLRVRIEVANTPKILSNGYNLATLFRAD